MRNTVIGLIIMVGLAVGGWVFFGHTSQDTDATHAQDDAMMQKDDAMMTGDTQSDDAMMHADASTTTATDDAMMGEKGDAMMAH